MSNAPFSLVDGGPLCRLIRRLGWVRPDGRCDYLRACLAVVAVTWGPLFVLSMVERVVTGRVPSIDWSVHARLLVTIPLLFMAEASLHWRSRRAIGVFLEERWASDQADRVAKIIAFAEKLRDAAAPEVILLGLALVGGQAVVWQAGGLRSLVSGLLLDPQQVAPKYWYALVSLPVFQFLLFRALWRWGIWAQLLWRLSRLRLRPIATHPDLAGGLGFLSLPSEGFAFVVAGLSATQAGVYANQIIVEDAAITSFTPNVVIFTLAAVVLALGPLLVFARHLVRCRIMGGTRIRWAGDATTRGSSTRAGSSEVSGAICSEAPISSRLPISRARARSFTTCGRCRSPDVGNLDRRGSLGADDSGRAAAGTRGRTAEDHRGSGAREGPRLTPRAARRIGRSVDPRH